MATKIHILHLHSKGLAWVTLDGRLPKGRIADQGSIEGEAIPCLDGWLSGKSAKDSEIYLFDSRPQYFSFIVSVPAKAAKEADKIIPLRVRQEIGLGEETARWSIRCLNEIDGHVHILVIVSRKENQDDLSEFRERNNLRSLWVSSDLVAIYALREHKLLDESSSLICRLTDDSPVLYKAEDKHLITRTVSHDQELILDESAIALLNIQPLEAKGAFQGLGAVPSPDSVDRLLGRIRAKLDPSIHDQVKNIDGILIGGLFEVGFKRPATSSILGEVEFASPLVELEKRLKPKPMAMLAAATALILIGSFAFARFVRNSDTERAKDKAQQLDEMTELYNKQSDILSRVKSDRKQLIPFIEAVYKVAPADSTLQSLDVAENGLMIIAATTKTQEAGTAFFKDLANSNLFDDIQITYLKLDDGKKWVRLQINAKVKGWKKR